MVKRTFILNPAARTCPPDLEARIRERFEGAEVLRTDAPGDGAALAAKVVRSGLSENDLLVACGGDGTFAEVVLGSAGKATLGIIPVGTVNQVSARLGIPASVEGALELLEGGTKHYLTPGLCRIDGEGGEEVERHFFIGISVGPDADSVHAVNPYAKRLIGRYAYGLAFAKRIFSPVRPTILCRVEGGEPEKLSQVMVLKDSVYGGKFTFAPETRLEQALLAVVGSSGGRLAMVKMLGSALGFCSPGYDNCHAEKVSLSLSGVGRFQIDGDAVFAEEVEVSLAPWKLSVLGGPS
jgi:diacylglycerol kinase family enzyme